MKRAWKWTAAIVGIPTVVTALLWVDSYYRAVAAIRAEDERLAKDIAAFRARKTPELPVDGAFLLGHAAAPVSFYPTGDSSRLELGHSGNKAFYDKLYLDRCGLSTPSTTLQAPATSLPGDPTFSGLTLTWRTVQESGFDSMALGHGFEVVALRMLESILVQGLPAADLRRIIERIDRTLPVRPRFVDAFEAEHLMDRAEVLRVLHLKADPGGFIVRPPGWREFFSWRILLVKALRELDRDAEVLRPVLDLTDGKLEAAMDLLDKEPKVRLTRTMMPYTPFVRRQDHDEARCTWTLARTAAAIALFRAEHGRDAELPRVPQPLGFDGDTLRLRLSRSKELTWDVRLK